VFDHSSDPNFYSCSWCYHPESGHAKTIPNPQIVFAKSTNDRDKMAQNIYSANNLSAITVVAGLGRRHSADHRHLIGDGSPPSGWIHGGPVFPAGNRRPGCQGPASHKQQCITVMYFPGPVMYQPIYPAPGRKSVLCV
jgi:hypothetical protein